jgi:hypothetical protein
MDSLLLLSPSVVSTSTKTTSTSTTTCNPISSRVISDKIVIDFNAVQTMSKDRLSQLKQFTVQRYEKFAMAPPGREHYTLLEYLISTYAPVETNPCATVIQQQQQQQHRRHVGDIGTRYAASALALGASHGTVVRTFDLPNSKERREAFRGRSEEDWQAAVLAAGVHITFENVNLATVPDEDFRVHTATWFLSLDTHHLPYTVPFEREFFKRLAESGYQGMLFLDDIHLNAEMKKWWAELLENASSMGYRCFDLTAVGHSTGSGLVDFSGKVELIK